jgi:hypothetical protein
MIDGAAYPGVPWRSTDRRPTVADTSKHAPFDEGDEVFLKARVYRANSEQALIEFVSMEGPFSVRVPQAELEIRDNAVYVDR